jgi:hypothetical protein
VAVFGLGGGCGVGAMWREDFVRSQGCVRATRETMRRTRERVGNGADSGRDLHKYPDQEAARGIAKRWATFVLDSEKGE